jgi:hypothetical protein
MRRIPNMDGVVRALVSGKLCYPRIDWHIVPSVKPNHKSWENPEVKAVLGLKMGTWLCQGALEWVDPRCPKPTIREPKVSVPKKGPEKFRDIADAREGNKLLADWGVRMHTMQDAHPAGARRRADAARHCVGARPQGRLPPRGAERVHWGASLGLGRSRR